MIRNMNNLAEDLIFNFSIDAKCKDLNEFDIALNLLIKKTEEAKVKLLKSKQISFDV